VSGILFFLVALQEPGARYRDNTRKETAIKKQISFVTILAMVLVMVAPALAGEENSGNPGRRNEPAGQLVSDPHSGRSSFTATNGFTIESHFKGRRMSVIITDDLGNQSVRFEVDPPRHGVRDSEFRMEVGGASFVHRSGVEGEPGEVEISRSGRSARFSDRRELDPGGEEDTEQEAVAFYSFLQEVLFAEADYQFWQGVAVLAQEMNTVAIDPVDCWLGCLGCVAAILGYIALIGGLVIGCNISAPACIVAVLGHLGSNFTVMAACGSCLVCIDQLSEEVDQRGTGTLAPNVQL